MRRKYIAIPVDGFDPGLKGKSSVWLPTLNVRLVAKHVQTPWVQAVVDSGSPYCLFRSALADYLHMDVTRGAEGNLGGIISGYQEKVYFHRVKIIVEANWSIEVYAGFMRNLRVAAILGRNGFFDNFFVRFDHSCTPPELEVEKIPSVQ